jgi:outer membrane protein OmpA-like peptidoglycan-associated protein
VDVLARPGPGERVALPVVREPRGAAQDRVADLYGVVERVVQARREAEGVEQVTLRSDVLFAFDDATLDGNARAVLADVIAEMRQRADPAHPPVAVVGHTDGIGEDAYNQRLSERRAAAVRDVLAAELGAGFQIQAAGLGSSRPVAEEGGPDDSEARARNRRVEIAYRFRQDTGPTATTTPELESEQVRATDPGEPAAFRTAYSEPVASREITVQLLGASQPTRWTLNVYPFYRDGAYLVASFDVVHRSGGRPFVGMGTFGISETRAGFAEFSAVDRASGTRYRDVRFGSGEDYRRIGPMLWPHVVAGGGTNRGYFYLPAPPEGVTELTFHAGSYGVFDGVPIQ